MMYIIAFLLDSAMVPYAISRIAFKAKKNVFMFGILGVIIYELLKIVPYVGGMIHFIGIVYAVAKRIIDFREQNGKFQTIEDIKKVRGIGEKTFAKIKDSITVK